MNNFIVPVLFVCVGMGAVLADTPLPSTDQAVVNAVKQVEEEMGNAMIRRDIKMLTEIYADDFATITANGKVLTRKDILQKFESPDNHLESFQNGPMDVQVFGRYAVAHAGVTEKRIRDGKDASGQFVWTDLLENRDGHWVVVRSAGAKVK
jgi:ketosteroid isomerase-like protein